MVNKFLAYSLKANVEMILHEKFPQKTSDIVQCFLDGNNKIAACVWKDGTIGFYIGKQRIYRYAITWYKGELYFQMKFDDFTEYFENTELVNQHLEKVDKKLVTRWRVDKNNTFIMSVLLKPETFYKTINDFVDLSLEVLRLYL